MNSPSISERFSQASLYIALVSAWVAMCGSLYFSEVLGYIPCTLCWYQRILMYPLAGILAIGLLRRNSDLPFYVLPFSLFGMGLATYHYLLQKTDIFGSGTVCEIGVPCTTMWINWFGFVTIPFLALTAFLIITLTALVAYQAQLPDPEAAAKTPWVPVAGLIAVVIAVFVGMAVVNRDTASESLALTTAPNLAGDMTPAEDDQGVEEARSVTEGQRLYRQACAACHGMNAEGVPNLGNTLAGSEFITAHSNEELLAFIRAGRTLEDPANQSGLVMPPSGGRPDFSDEQMLKILTYLRAQ